MVVAEGLRTVADGAKVWVAGVVTHRQRPATAGGVTFLNLEDEDGPRQCGGVARLLDPPPGGGGRGAGAAGPGTGGVGEGAVNVVAERLEPLILASPVRSRDFR